MLNKYTGKSFSTVLIYTHLNTGAISTISLLDAFGAYPAISKEAYQLLDLATVTARANARIALLQASHDAVEVKGFAVKEDALCRDTLLEGIDYWAISTDFVVQ